MYYSILNNTGTIIVVFLHKITMNAKKLGEKQLDRTDRYDVKFKSKLLWG